LKILSIFVDESGDLGDYDHQSPYYVLTCVFHEQAEQLTSQITKFKESLQSVQVKTNRAVHTAPLIRREDQYKHQSIDERRKQLYRLLNFTFSCPITYKSFTYEKRQFSDSFALIGKMSRDLSEFLQEYLAYFQSFDQIIVYYDNGQRAINQLLNSVFNTLFFDVDFRRASPHDYCLLQSADLVCTMEMLLAKQKKKAPSRSEEHFFYRSGELKRTFFKTIRKKRF